jgi:CRISPR-associated endonuclease/helicase Cas3
MGSKMLDDPLTQKVLLCWGKTAGADAPAAEYHPAIFHMIDVANVAKLLISEDASPRWRKCLSNVFNTNEAFLKGFVPFFISLHDIGKISAAFQSCQAVQKERLTILGFHFTHSSDLYHNQVSQSFLWNEWPSMSNYDLPDDLHVVLRDMAGGHHGRFLSPGDLAKNKMALKIEEHPEWAAMRSRAVEMLEGIFLINPPHNWSKPENISAIIMYLTGFTILCDWLGSDQRFFLPRPGMDIKEYVNYSLSKAHEAVSKAGFFDKTFSQISSEFSKLFQIEPRPLQREIDRIPGKLLSKPCLVILEAPTGEGKTEAALAMAHRIAQARGTDEFYYALPTMATSDQMYKRVKDYLDKQLGLKAQVKLVHGQAFLLDDDNPIKPLSGNDDATTEVEMQDWFGPKKRSLLSPFGVGTIDQVELGALNVRHSSLRLSGLAGKVIVLDEVHAYDVYMTTIIERLLSWLSALGSSVILLSATLPKSRSDSLIKAFLPDTEITGTSDNDYPSIRVISRVGSYISHPPTAQPERIVHLDYLHFNDDQSKEKAQWLVSAVQDGGCVCWITNTVDRAQKIYQAVKDLVGEHVDITLLHSRFPLSQRNVLEKQLVSKYGPNKSERPKTGIVIGTQVLEQSLDLDFDLMVSDIAPVDLLLQRAGRLHRHTSTQRPAGLGSPKFLINAPLTEDGQLQLHTDKHVYSEYFLLRTAQVLSDRNAFDLPDDFRTLVELVYALIPDKMSENMKKAYEELIKKEENARGEANIRLIPTPEVDTSFTGTISRLQFDENESSAEWHIAQTRLAEPSISVIPLEIKDDQAFLPGTSEPIALNQPANRNTQLKLLRNSLSISHSAFVKAFPKDRQNLPILFTKSALLKNYLPLMLNANQAVIQGGKGIISVRLDPELGLMIDTKGGK